MTIKIFSNNSRMNAQDELNICRERSFNLGNTDYYVDSTGSFKCPNPDNHGSTTMTLCESISDLEKFRTVVSNCRNLVKSLNDTVEFDESSVRLISIFRTEENFMNNIESGYDTDISLKDKSVTYLPDDSIEYGVSEIKKRGQNLNSKKSEQGTTFRKVFNNGRDFRNVPYSKNPYNSVVLIMDDNGSRVGSGVFISPQVILTCRHIFYNNDGSYREGSYSYVQGSNSPIHDNDVTTGVKSFIDPSSILIFPGSYSPGSRNDVAVIITSKPCNLTYDNSSYTKVLLKEDKTGIDISIIGYPYPNDVPLLKDKMQYGYLYESNGELSGSTDSGLLKYTIDTIGGNSGSGIFYNNSVIGIHVGGTLNDSNYAVDLDKEKIDWLNHIIRNNSTDGWYEHNDKKYYYDNNKIVPINDPDEFIENTRTVPTSNNNSAHLWRYNDFILGKGTNKHSSTNSSVNNDINNSGNSSPNGNNSNPGYTGQLTGKMKDAIASALDSSNWNSTTDGGNPGIDMDGGWGAQCFDLGNYYMEQLGVGWDRTNADQWNDYNFVLQYKSQFERLGWRIIEFPTLEQLVVGSITFENDQGVGMGVIEYGGHTEIITAIEGNSVSFLTQNPNSPAILTTDGGGEPRGTWYKIQAIVAPPGG